MINLYNKQTLINANKQRHLVELVVIVMVYNLAFESCNLAWFQTRSLCIRQPS